MQLCDVFQQLGEDRFAQLLRSVSMGKLKTYQLFERLKLRIHVGKLNTESLRKSAPKLLSRLAENDQELATDLSQAVLVSHLDMIVAVLNFLEIPHEEGFFAKDVDAASFLTEGWEERIFAKFHGQFPEALLVFYINHLGLELKQTEQAFIPAVSVA